jgi:hypothetical protein
MHMFVRVFCACYSALLILHSRRLRDAYGQEMVDVLRYQMLDALNAKGNTGPLLPAGRALGELFTIAIPSRLNQKRLAVVSAALCTSFALLFALCRVVLNQDILDPWMSTIGLQCR